MGLQFLFMDDNAPCHRTVFAEQLLKSEDIECMDWPARSPDLNPIEHVWDFLGRRLAARTLPPVTIRELRLALQDEWGAMPQQLIDTLNFCMGRCCETCLAWHRRFIEGKESVEDDKCSRRPQTSCTNENIENVSAVVRRNRLQTTAESVRIPSAPCQRIPTKDLNMHIVCQHIVPRMLNDQSADEVKSASQAELKDMAKIGFQKCFVDLYERKKMRCCPRVLFRRKMCFSSLIDNIFKL
ncbi:transposable element Tc3 transposase [Trichonephila clavipes]|nr:transposable element Tc3 transposase [Trichonephila clavipes]